MDQAHPNPSQLFGRLVTLSEEAAASGQFEVAYYALMAALHAAEREANAEAVLQVCKVGAAQEGVIERQRPPHPLSHAAAARRRTESVYSTLQTQAQAVRLRIEGPGHLQRPLPEVHE
jgi:hypothetical protein